MDDIEGKATSPTRAADSSPPRWARAVVRHAARLLLFGPLVVAALAAAGFVVAAAIGVCRGEAVPATTLFALVPGGAGLVWVDSCLPMLLLSWACLGCGASWIARTLGHGADRSWRRGERTLARQLGRGGLPLAIVATWFSLAVVWSLAPRGMHEDDHTPYAAWLGRIPWSDALGYYRGAEGIAACGELDMWSQRRPINAALFSVRLAVVGFHAQRALLLQGLLSATALYLAARAAGARYGVWAGVAAFALLFAYAKLFVATTLSENLGITFGALAAALLVRAVQDRRAGWAALGAFATALAMSARAGALCVLPLLALWALWQFGPGLRRRLTAAVAVAAALALAVSASVVLLKLYGTGENALGSNFAPTLCGMTEGSDWRAIYEKYSGELGRCHDEREQAAFLYARAWKNIQAEPSTFLAMVARGEAEFLRALPRYLPSLTALHAPLPSSIVRKVNRWDACAYYALYVGAAFSFWRRRRDGDYGLAAALALGTLASAPFVFLDGGWRVLAASWPLMVVLLSAGCASAPRRRGSAALATAPCRTAQRATPPEARPPRRPSRATTWHDRLTLGLTIALPVLAVVGPWCVHRLAAKPTPAAIAAARAAGHRLVRKWPDVPAVAIVDEGQLPPRGMPAVSLKTFQQIIARRTHEGIDSITPLPATPFVVAAAYDFAAPTAAQNSMILYGPMEFFTAEEPFIRLCVEEPSRAGLYWLVVGPAAPNHHAQTDLHQLRR